jgi:hypothetical protein
MSLSKTPIALVFGVEFARAQIDLPLNSEFRREIEPGLLARKRA